MGWIVTSNIIPIIAPSSILKKKKKNLNRLKDDFTLDVQKYGTVQTDFFYEGVAGSGR